MTEAKACPECGCVFESKRGMSTHHGQMHDGPLPEPDESILRELYVEKQLSLRDVADRTNYGATTIRKRMDEYGIEKRDRIAALTTASRRKPAPLKTQSAGYEIWRTQAPDGVYESVTVHRLLAVSEFGFETVAGMDVHHKNKIPWDNRVENIELMSRSEHMRHHNPPSLTDIEKIRVAELYRNGETTQRQLAEDFGVSRGTIKDVLVDIHTDGRVPNGDGR